MKNRDAAVSIPHMQSSEREGGGGDAAGFFPSGALALGAPATIAAEITDFSAIPAGVNTSYQSAAAGFATPFTLSAADIAGTGWDVSAQAGNNSAPFLIRGIGTAGNGDGDASSLRFQAGDVDWVVFRSNEGGFHFDLSTFALRNAGGSDLTVQALDAAGATTGSAVAFTLLPSTGAFTEISLAGNPDFAGIYGFKVTFDTAADAPFFDNLVVANIGVPAPPAVTVTGAALLADTGSSASDFVTRTAAQTIEGTLSAVLGAGESVQVSFDGGAHWSDATGFSVGSADWSTTATLAGSATFMARVTNADGNSAAWSHAFALDTQAPDAPAFADPDPGSSHVTGQTAPAFSGTAEAGATVMLYDSDGSTVLGTDTADGGGHWHIVPAALGEGVHDATLKAVDLAGNESTASPALALTVDTVAPVAVALSLDSVASSAAGSGAAIATLSASDSTAVTYTLVAGDGSNDAANARFAIAGNMLSVGAAALDAGIYQIYLAATDAAGNVSHLAQTITVLAVPAVSSIVRAGDADAGLTAGATTADYTVTFSEAVGGVDAGDFTLDASGTAYGHIAAVSGSGTTYTVTIDSLAGDGTLRLDLNPGGTAIHSGADVAIGAGYAAGESYLLDHTAPAAPVLMDPTADGNHVIAQSAPALGGTAETGSLVTLYDSDGTVLGTDRADDGTWSIVPALAQGSHSLSASAVDAAGNVSTASTDLALTVDTLAPADVTLSVARVAASAAAGGAAVATLSASDSTAVTYALVAGDGDNDAANARFTVAGNTLSVGSEALDPGSYRVYLAATDAAGNVSHLAEVVTVLAGPGVTSIVRTGGAGIDVAADAASADYTVTFSEAVTGVDTADFALAATGTAGGRIAAVSGSGSTYTVTVDGLAGDGTLRLDLNGSGTDIRSSADVAIGAGYGSGEAYLLDHTAPAAPAGLALPAEDDTGASGSDAVTATVAPRVTGLAEAFASVRLYDTDGSRLLGSVQADDAGRWTIATPVLAAGSHVLSAVQTDAAGNVSHAATGLTVTIDTTAAALAAPVLDAASDSGAAGDGLTRIVKPSMSGTAEAYASVWLYDSDGVTVLGTAKTGAAGTWTIAAHALADGVHDVSARQVDRAGNVSAPGAALHLTVDTLAPAAPGIPLLAPASDTGVKGDGSTANAQPRLGGHGEAQATVTLYDTDGTTVLASTRADAAGNWSATTAALASGHHAISAVQTDGAGNASAAGPALDLTIVAPPAPAPGTPAAPVTIDGVQVRQQPVTLPGGASGVQTTIPIVTAGRVETAGSSGVADIPLATAGGATLLLAQVGVDVGLTVTGGAAIEAGSAAERLVQAIVAATPGHSAGDQGHLTGNGQSFLDLLPAQVPLLVQTVAPVAASRATGTPLTLTGTSTPDQHTALVIDTSGFGTFNTLALKDVDFAVIVGAATVSGATRGQVLTGDAAAQTFIVDAGLGSSLFAGGGNDTLRFTHGTPPGAASGSAAGHAAADAVVDEAAGATTLVHGGLGADTVAFAGARADYTIDAHDGHLVVSANGGAHEAAYVINAETLQFTDGSMQVEVRAALASIAGLYADVLGRQADVGGFAFWGGFERGGATLGQVALAMMGTQESQARHGAFSGDAGHDIAMLYEALFGRAADAAGAAYWGAALHAGATLEQVADAFMHAPEIVGRGLDATQWDFTY